jgi:hypothetical protein
MRLGFRSVGEVIEHLLNTVASKGA